MTGALNLKVPDQNFHGFSEEEGFSFSPRPSATSKSFRVKDSCQVATTSLSHLPPLYSGTTTYYANKIISSIQTKSDVVCLINCTVLNFINFVDENENPKNGGIIVMDKNSKLLSPQKTNAKEIIKKNSILNDDSDRAPSEPAEIGALKHLHSISEKGVELC